MGILSYGYKGIKAIKAIKPTKMSKGTKTTKEGYADVSKIVAKKSKENPRIKEQIKEEGIKTKAGMTKSLLKHNLREKKMGGGMMGRQMYKKGGKSFPDLTGDGKVTKKDILRGRGVPGFAVGGRSTGKKIKQSKTGSAQIAESLNPKTKSAIKRITGSNEYKKADYKGKTKMLGGKFFTAKEMKK